MSIPSAVLGAIAAVAVLVGLDVVVASGRAPSGLGIGGRVAFVAFGLALGGTAFGAIAAIDAMARRLRGAARSAAAWFGAVEGSIIFSLAVLAQDPRTVAGNDRVYLLFASATGMAAGRAALFAIPERLRARVVAGLAAVVAIAMIFHGSQLRYNGHEWTRIAVDGVAILAAARLAGTRSATPRLRRVTIAVFASCVAILLGSGWVLANDDARALLSGRSAHVRSWARPIEKIADRDHDGAANIFGGFDCAPSDGRIHPRASEIPGNGVDDNCSGADAPPRAMEPDAVERPSSAAAGSDVLVLSIDALRSDAGDALVELREALGPHVEFTRAQSPAPATKESLAATMRGVADRLLALELHPDVRGPLLWRDANPSLGHVLRDAGYRTVTVPSNNMFEPRIGVTSGFESLWLANADATGIEVERPPHTQDYVPTAPMLALGLRVAERTPGPLCLWLHLMDTHSPYHHPDGTTGPRNRSGYDAAVRETASAVAVFLGEFTRVRGHAPIVVIVGDHGEEFGEHGGIQHASTVYLEQVGVTLLIAAPGLEARTIDTPVSTSGLPRTVLGLLGLEAPPSMAEPSLLAARDPNVVVVSESSTAGGLAAVGYTRGMHRIVVDPIHRTAELFDLEADPGERHDLARARPDLLAELLAAAQGWNERH